MSFDRLSERSKEYRAQGLCPDCGAEPELDRVRCSEHTRYQRTRLRELRKERRSAGLCAYCGEHSGKRYGCKECRTRIYRANSESMRRITKERKELGVCTKCAGEREDRRYQTCRECRDKQIAARRKR